MADSRRSFFATALLAAAALSLAAIGCGNSGGGPRALILADGSGTPHTVGVAARAKNFETRTGRAVRVLVVEPQQAVLLASRGEADVAVVPMEVSLDTFLASEHGKMVGTLRNGGEQLRILEVDAKQHPKVDAQGAHQLASAMITPPP